MKKTKDIEVWICPMALASLEKYPQGYNAMIRNNPAPEDVRAKLIIEVPEKKVEITESRFSELINHFFNDKQPIMKMDDFLRHELFGSEK